MGNGNKGITISRLKIEFQQCESTCTNPSNGPGEDEKNPYENG